MRVIHLVNVRSRLKLGSNVRQLLIWLQCYTCFRWSHRGQSMTQDPSIGLVRLVWEVKNWNVSAIYYSILNKLSLIANDATVTQDSLSSRRVTYSFGLSGFWAQEQCGLLFAICDGWGFNSIVTTAVDRWVEVRPGLRDWNRTICFWAPTTPVWL